MSADKLDNHKQGISRIGAYIAFIISLLLVITFDSEQIKYSSWIISLMFISLPSLIVVARIDYLVRVQQNRKRSMFRGLATFLGFVPSFIAIILFVASFSIIASIIFTLLTFFWMIVIDFMTYIGFKEDSEI